MSDFAFRKQQLDNPPLWANDVLQAWDETAFEKKRNFIQSHYWTAQGSVNVFNVVGTIHDDYKNKSWLNLLQNGKRMHTNLPLLAENPGYYTQAGILRQPTMDFITTDGIHFYINNDGNHRTCLARFYFYNLSLTHIHNIEINHYRIDEPFYYVYTRLKTIIQELKLPINLQPEHTRMKREDTGGWKESFFRTVLQWTENGRTETLDFEAAEAKWLMLNQHGGGLSRKIKRLIGKK
ncbi:hypothetical protein [Stenoxybacter acetivorans]|uniref:hypothetical protein n=1 Tax=Stenoxybacter acetivorans TaxID=422441 RepID=UPI00068CDCFB|nr:hypothetical protein [Stenoxybacter acetivorans]